jgi:hypothetical protein
MDTTIGDYPRDLFIAERRGGGRRPMAESSVLPDETALMPLEILHRPLVLFHGVSRLERAEIPSLAGPPVFLPRIQAVGAARKLPDHAGAATCRLAQIRRRKPPIRQMIRQINRTKPSPLPPYTGPP